MFTALRKVEDYLQVSVEWACDAQQALEEGHDTVEVNKVLDVMYKTYEVVHPEEEEKWMMDGLSIGFVDDSFQQAQLYRFFCRICNVLVCCKEKRIELGFCIGFLCIEIDLFRAAKMNMTGVVCSLNGG